ncbi:integral membrane protein [Actinomyces sp. Chiba101]|uniref:DUF7847 domain-containing protein n=2 Tax=Actinomyces denticolens TaxID=52767 RepID=A0ABY1I0D2_9ACTO|nr:MULTISPECIES: hypothetical protein [Actinomyces]BAW93761.1 integral membrane protein [Actinomyces sp. Chiba101]SHI29680.1 hypothetical protein SAMN05216246_101121 [Actinomyces denticolens]SUU74271.1 Predicted integral membrane protein [Actinomyces denticolens]
MSDDSSDWLPPSQPDAGGAGAPGADGGPAAVPGAGARPAYGAYGTPPAGRGAPADGMGGGNPYGDPQSFFPAPKPGIIPLRPLGIGDIISGAFESMRANPRAMFIPALLTMAVVGAINAAGSYLLGSSLVSIIPDPGTSQSLTPEEAEAQLASLLLGLAAELGSLILTFLATTVLSGLLIMTVSRSVLGRVVSASEVWTRVKGRMWALIGQSLLISLVSFATVAFLGGLVLLAMYGIVRDSSSSLPPGLALLVILTAFAVALLAIALSWVFMVRFTCAPSALILEDIGIIESLKRSWRLSRGSFWRVFGALLLAVLITVTASSVLALPISLLISSNALVGGSALPLMAALQSFLTDLVQAVILPFSAAVSALIYIDLRMRGEGLDVELRRAAQA